MIVTLGTCAIGWVSMACGEELGTETGFDLEYMDAEFAKRHGRSDASLQLGAKSGRDAAKYVSDKEKVFCVGREEELLKVYFVFVIVGECLVWTKIAADALLF